MANRVTITICGEEYTLVADESSAYMQKVGSYVSDKMTEVLEGAKVARTDAAVLTAVNLADELFKSQTAAERSGCRSRAIWTRPPRRRTRSASSSGRFSASSSAWTPGSNGVGASIPRRFAGGSPCRRAERLRRGVSGLGRVQRPPGRQKFHGRGICRRHSVLSCPGRPGLSHPEYPCNGPGAARRAGRRPHRLPFGGGFRSRAGLGPFFPAPGNAAGPPPPRQHANEPVHLRRCQRGVSRWL